ncbi:MAG: hypothetical protein GY846_19445 [Deltaproteobacteria bacterium]|nr:hypothetical protein [Deltaproteobacteria bacterium]
MMWHTITNLKQSVSEISANVEIDPDSHWFSGHFPGEPILPGIAQLGIVFEAIEQSRRQKLVVSGLSRVRFKQIIRPDDPLKIVIAPVEKTLGSYSFSITVDEELACSGTMMVHEQDR